MKITIIGGGAAGMMAAASVAEADPSAKITIIEKNTKLGRKLVATGGGRCNITTAITDVNDLMQNYPRGSRWLKYAMHEFGPKQTINWFEDHGIKLKTEELRVFPASENGEQVVDMFLRIFKQANIQYNSEVKSLDEIDADKIIITTGGKEGGGYKLAESIGHTIVPLAPTLTSFICDLDNLAGVSIKKAKLKLNDHEFTGPFLFTHTGITGPAVFAISAFSAYENLSDLFVDFVPDLNQEQLKEEFFKNSDEIFKKEIQKYLPKSVIESLSLDWDKKIAEISKKHIEMAIAQLKSYRIPLTGRTPGREIVTAGGIDTTEVDPKTMQSKINPKIYFAGEILNVDGLTGGFNLQIAWATGKLAGESCI